MNLGRWEWAIGEIIVLPLLFFELFRLRRSQRRDREAAAREAAAGESGMGATPEAGLTRIAHDTAFLQADEGDERR